MCWRNADRNDIDSLLLEGRNHVHQKRKGGLGRFGGIRSLRHLQVARNLIEAVSARSFRQHDEAALLHLRSRCVLPHQPVVVPGVDELSQWRCWHVVVVALAARFETKRVRLNQSEGVVVVLVKRGVRNGKEQCERVAGIGIGDVHVNHNLIPHFDKRHGKRTLQLPVVSVVSM